MRICSILVPSFLCCLFLATIPAGLLAEDCLTAGCHPRIDALKQRHAPVEEGDCSSCHEPQSAKHPAKGVVAFKLTAKGGELCSACHDAPGQGKIAHPPAEEGDCLACHNPHGGPGSLLRNADQGTLCGECHDSYTKQPYQHGPVAAGDCTACHDPHRSGEKRLLKQPVRALCLSCHTEFTALDKAPVSHPPVREDPCTTCHQPHSSPAPNLLASEQPGVCVECHDQIGTTMEKAKTRHAPLYEKKSCGGCHSSHYADHAGLLPFEQKELCLSCHSKGGAAGKNLRDIAQEIKGKKYLHDPVKSGECNACHAPHGADNFRMLAGAYPATFYAPYQPGIYDLCLQCHEQDLLRFPETTINTQFRNGKQNLHYLHVANQRKGRTCRACHEPHASDNDKLISVAGAKFGDWRIPVRFKVTATGGSCAPGCHRELGYDRDKPVDYRH